MARRRQSIQRVLDGDVIAEAFAQSKSPFERSGSLTPAEDRVATRAIKTLSRAYPGHQWGADVNGPLLTIQNRALVGRWGYRIRLLEHTETSLEREIIRAGGECLERFRQARGAPNPDTLREAARDHRGHMVPDL